MIMRKKNLLQKTLAQTRQLTSTHQGWTLVELVVTVVVIAIMAIFAAPEVLTWQTNMRVSSAARELYGAMNSARVSAIERNANIVVAATATPTNTLNIFVDDGGGPGGTPANAKNGTFDVGETALNTYTLNSKVSGRDYRDAHINSVIAGTIGFTPRGIPIGGNGNILIRNSASNRWFRIALSASGSLTLLQSTNSTNGTDGTWN